MNSKVPSPAQRSTALLSRIFSTFQKRRLLPGGAAREKMDAHLSRLLDELALVVKRPVQFHLEEAPPRTLALPFALALQSHALLSTFFSDAQISADSSHSIPAPVAPDRPILLQSEVIQKGLGLHDWELNELREEVDRSVAERLKQERALDWLWTHFKMPSGDCFALFNLLFPSTPQHISVTGFIRSGRQLYAVIQDPSPTPRHTLFLPGESGLQFEGRYVDLALRNSLSRALGTNDLETIQLLDEIVTAIPQRNFRDFCAHDSWRVRGFAGITGLGATYPAPPGVLSPESIDTSEWLHFGHDNDAQDRGFKIAFDQLALTAVERALRCVYADLLASLANPSGPSNVEALHQLDTQNLLITTLTPLIQWAESPQTVSWIASQRDESLERATQQLKRVATAWRAQMNTGWTGAPKDGHPRSVACLLCVHLCQLGDTLKQLLEDQRAAGPKLRDMLFLFAGFHLSEAPLQRLWVNGLSEAGAPSQDAFSDLFIATWNRLFLRDDDEADTFSGAFALEF